MSDGRAIEAVTETLRGLIDAGVRAVVPGAVTIVDAPNEAATAGNNLQLNLFLYQAEVDGALRNTPATGVLPGESGDPALPLVLHYLLSASSTGGEIAAHGLLGAALQTLHSHPVLTGADLRGAAPYSNVADQVERVRIDWQPFDEKDIYSLWSVFQTPYRLSVALEVRVVLIDSRRPPVTAVPVLRRGADARGPVANADVRSPLPAVSAIVYPLGQPAGEVGTAVTLEGHNLGATVAVRIEHRTSTTPIDVVPTAVTATAVTFSIPANVPAGGSVVSLLQAAPAPPTAVPASLAIAPRIANAMPMSVARDATGAATIALTCDPPVEPGQRVMLLLGTTTSPLGPISATTASLTFTITAADPGAYVARIRIDDVDSLFIDDRTSTSPLFVPTQMVTIS